MNWKNQLQKLGVAESELSISLKKKVKDYYTIETGINELTQKIKEEEDDEEIAAMQESLQELKIGAQQLNEHLLEAIDKWFKNKDLYQKRGEALKNHRMAKKGAAPVTKPVESAPAPAPAVVKTGGEVTEVKEKKESSNFIVWALGAVAIGIVAVVTLGKVRE